MMKIKAYFEKMVFPGQLESEAEQERGFAQLVRVITVIDVLYALIIFRLFTLLPNPDIDNFGASELITVLKSSFANYTVMIIGIVLVLIYWQQSNLIFGNIKRTDPRHSSISILQVVCLMVYLYFIKLDTQFGSSGLIMRMQSIMLALAGFFAIYSWFYAIKKEIISDAVDVSFQQSVYIKLIPEPLIALITIPLSYLGTGIWTLGWLLVIPVGIITKRKFRN